MRAQRRRCWRTCPDSSRVRGRGRARGCRATGVGVGPEGCVHDRVLAFTSRLAPSGLGIQAPSAPAVVRPSLACDTMPKSAHTPTPRAHLVTPSPCHTQARTRGVGWAATSCATFAARGRCCTWWTHPRLTQPRTTTQVWGRASVGCVCRASSLAVSLRVCGMRSGGRAHDCTEPAQQPRQNLRLACCWCPHLQCAKSCPILYCHVSSTPMLLCTHLTTVRASCAVTVQPSCPSPLPAAVRGELRMHLGCGPWFTCRSWHGMLTACR